MKSVLITGTSTGVGRATALYMDKLGYKVFAGVRNNEDANSLQQEASQNLVPVMIDISDRDSIAGAFEQINQIAGRHGLAGLVNNAGIPMGGSLEFFDQDKFRMGVEVNFLGHIHMIQTFLPLIRKQKGRIINVGSIGGVFPIPYTAPYSASKAAMHNITHILRRELLPEGIHVSLIILGTIKTAIWGKAEKLTKPVSRGEEDLYGQGLQAMGNVTKKMATKGLPPECAAKVIEKALTGKRPKSQYVVGTDAKLQIIASILLPHRILDRLFMFALRVKSSK